MVDVKPSQLGLDMSQVIDRRVYTDPEVYRREMELIFARTWQFVAHESEVPNPGDFFCTVVAGQPIILCRDRDGKLSAFYNTCTHRGAMLASKRKGNSGAAFRCMYHGWTFDLHGKCTGVPYPDAYGSQFDRSTYDIPALLVDTFAGLVFVSLSHDVVPLAEYMGDVGPYVSQVVGGTEVLGRVRWTYEGNWKLWHENNRDNYHPEFTHRVVGAGYKGQQAQGNNYWLDDGHGLLKFPPQRDAEKILAEMKAASGLDNDVGNNPIWQRPPFKVDFKQNHLIITVFPNLDMQTQAGGTMNVVRVARPISPDRTMVEVLALGMADESPEARQWRLERCMDGQSSTGKVTGDDANIMVLCQGGYSATSVPWSNMSRGQGPGKVGEKQDEYSLRAFYDTWRRYMGEYAL